MADRWQELVALDDINEAAMNPKGHDDEGIDASLDRFGFVEPLTIDERTGRLVAGHGRLARLRHRAASGGERPAGVELDGMGRWLVPVNRGWASANDAEALAVGVALNRLTERGGWQPDPLAAVLVELRDGPGLIGTGYTPDDLDRLLAELGPSNFDPIDEADVPRLDRKVCYQCPKCGAVVDPGVVQRIEK